MPVHVNPATVIIKDDKIIKKILKMQMRAAKAQAKKCPTARGWRRVIDYQRELISHIPGEIFDAEMDYHFTITNGAMVIYAHDRASAFRSIEEE